MVGILIKFILFVLSALAVAAMLSLIKIGAHSILEFAENKWNGSGAVVVIILWFITFPIMVIISLVLGFYRCMTVKQTYTA